MRIPDEIYGRCHSLVIANQEESMYSTFRLNVLLPKSVIRISKNILKSNI